MQTRCPACQTLYRIDDDVLQRAGGQARCFRCDNVFDAYTNPADSGEEPADEAHDPTMKSLHEQSPEKNDLDDWSSLADLPDVPEANGFSSDSDLDLSSLADELRQPPVDSPDNDSLDLPSEPTATPQSDDLREDLPFKLPDDLPELEPTETEPLTTEQALTPQPSHSLTRSVLPGLAAVLLVLAALGQLTWQHREQALSTPAGHSMAEGLCGLFGCTLPARRAPSRFAVLERNIGPVPGQTGVLALHLSLRNTAKFAQPLPDIQLSLYDSEEKLMARRRLHPDEYLFPAPLGGTLVESGTLLQVDLQLEDPGRKATGFKLEFL